MAGAPSLAPTLRGFHALPVSRYSWRHTAHGVKGGRAIHPVSAAVTSPQQHVFVVEAVNRDLSHFPHNPAVHLARPQKLAADP